MLESEDVDNFLDRNPDLGWHYVIRGNGIHSWAVKEAYRIYQLYLLGPYPTLEAAVDAAKKNDLHAIYVSLHVSMVPKHMPDFNDREKKLNYIRRCTGWDLDAAYNPVKR